jgi:hypothetical protein
MDSIACNFFDGVPIDLDREPASVAETAALEAFLRLGPADRLAASRHIYAYYLDFHQAIGGEDWLDAAMGIPATPADIWSHVHPRGMFLEDDIHSAAQEVYLVIEAECDWEEEHGLMLCFRNGARLTKCGGYDGHLTNVNAYADARLANVVYAASNPKFQTLLDP